MQESTRLKLFAVCSAIGILSAKLIRLAIEHRSILLDCSPNFFSTILLSVIFHLDNFNFADSLGKAVLASTTLHLIYELIQIVLPGFTYDPNDLLASVAGGLVLYLIGKP